jgi:peptidoglycan hydrolase-like protein with peptidoglycan-binding domain
MSLSSFVVDQLETSGIPLQYASKVAGMFTGDIITLGLRLALIGLFAGLVRTWSRRVHRALDEGKSRVHLGIGLM